MWPSESRIKGRVALDIVTRETVLKQTKKADFKVLFLSPILTKWAENLHYMYQLGEISRLYTVRVEGLFIIVSLVISFYIELHLSSNIICCAEACGLVCQVTPAFRN